MGAKISKENSYSNFTFYFGVKPHLCKKRSNRNRRSRFYYKHSNKIVSDLFAIKSRPKYKNNKRLLAKDLAKYKLHDCVAPQIKCSCPLTIQLIISSRQQAISSLFEPHRVYKYQSKVEVSTKKGFNIWLYEITKKLHHDSEFRLFVESFGSCVSGTTFYDGAFLKKQFAKIKSDANDFEGDGFVDTSSDPTFLNQLKELTHQSSVYDQDNFIVTNTIPGFESS